MSDTNARVINSINDDYVPKHTAGNTTSTDCGIAYFMAAFCEFVQATGKFQEGTAELAKSMEGIVKQLNDAKNSTLMADNSNISRIIDQLKADPDNKYLQNTLTQLQAGYKLDETVFTSKIQAMSPSAQQDTDATTSVSQNNSQIFQIAMYMIGPLQTLIQLLRAA